MESKLKVKLSEDLNRAVKGGDKVRRSVIRLVISAIGYAKIAKQSSSCCSPAASCCGSTDLAQGISKSIGYTDEELTTVPEGANLGLGCGNPVALASLRNGETVLDLGSGAGFDCFLAANRVGETGKVIGVDIANMAIEDIRKGEGVGVIDPHGDLIQILFYKNNNFLIGNFFIVAGVLIYGKKDIFIEADVKEENVVRNLGTGADETMRASFEEKSLVLVGTRTRLCAECHSRFQNDPQRESYEKLL